MEPSTSSFGRVSGGASATRRQNSTIPAPTATSPANTHRHDAYVVATPPISGPTAIAIAPAAPTRPYARGRSPAEKLPATSATIAGMISAAPTPSRNDQPSSSTPRFGASAVVSDPEQ
jgi:hypothetical protein